MKGRFANSPVLANELTSAIIDAFAAHFAMCKQALGSERSCSGRKEAVGLWVG